MTCEGMTTSAPTLIGVPKIGPVLRVTRPFWLEIPSDPLRLSDEVRFPELMLKFGQPSPRGRVNQQRP